MGHLEGPYTSSPQQRMADAGHVNPDLMGSSRLQAALQVSEASEPLQYPVMGDGISTASFIYGHFFPVHRMSADGSVYRALFFLQVSVDDGPVFPGDGMVFKLLRQKAVGGVRFADHKGTGGILIDPMDDSGPHHPVDFRTAGLCSDTSAH